MIDAPSTAWHCDADFAVLQRDGYCTVKLADAGVIERASDAAVKFFAQSARKKRAWLSPSGHEEGYLDRLPVKEMFMVRRRPLPAVLSPVGPAWHQLDGMAATLLDGLSHHLNMPGRGLSDLMPPQQSLQTDASASVMRLLHYFPSTDEGAAPHVDLGLVTWVPRSTWPALQVDVLDARSRTWHDVESQLPPDRAIVLTGAALEWCTSNQMPAALHRVRACSKYRFSLAYQVRPDGAAMIPAVRHSGATGAASPSMPGHALMTRLRQDLISVNLS